ncbi:MAG: Flp pilus assembly protein CpaB [Candidatus Firestonebacteria bacterium RIFOXYA2_FULL_40_8]|nr:MAG: Flp pilus assembly protein CpaB [Candidatus Firestonebacteria bacterium RIFOXYA2_FULL_40_8]
MRNKNLIFALVLSAIGALILFAYFSGKEKELTARGTLNIVIVAAKYIPAGAAITQEHLKIEEIPGMYIQPGAIRKTEQAVGAIAVANISAGEQILANKITVIAENLSSIVPIGYRAVAINLDADSAVGEFLKPGDVVDVLGAFEETGKASYTATLIQSVRVIAVNESFTPVKKIEEKGFPARLSSGSTVVLALEPSDAEIVTFSENKGKLKLSLRNPGDDKMATLRTTSFGNVLRNQQREAVKPAPEVPFLEIIRGTEGEKVPLKK